MSESSESETVGYKQPPRKTQFKPGKSGNPRGRPKRKVNMSESLNRVLDDKIVVTGFGKGKTGLEAFVQSVTRDKESKADCIVACARWPCWLFLPERPPEAVPDRID